MSMKRILVLSGIIFGVPTLMIWNHVGLWIDDLLFPNWGDEKIINPLFIVGNARSGTTFMHRLLTETDNDKLFTTMRTWEILFAISITWKLLFKIIWKIDATLCFGIGMNILTTTEIWLLGKASAESSVHRVGLQLPEEDEWVMIHIGLSQLIMLLFPLGGALMDDIIFFDYAQEQEVDIGSNTGGKESTCSSRTGNGHTQPQLSASVRHAIMGYYRQCVQRHLYTRRIESHFGISKGSSTGGYIFVSKNPPFTMRLHSLHARFPGARCIVMLRKPITSVPSMVSYIGTVWSTFACPVTKYPKAKDLIGFCKAHYEYPREVICSNEQYSGQNQGNGILWSEKHAYWCRYESLLKSPMTTVQVAMKHLYNIDITHMLLRLQDEESKQMTYKSSHKYILEEVCDGMSAAELAKVLKECSYE